MIALLAVVLAVLIGALAARFVVQSVTHGRGIRRRTTYRPNGYTHTYTRGRVLHREDGPAVDRRRSDGSVAEEHYYLEGREHRVGGPAIVHFHEQTRVMIREDFFVQGKPHRIDGPAEIHRFPDGEVSGARWFFLGTEAENHSAVLRLLSCFVPAQFEAELRASSYRVLLDEGLTVEQITPALRSGITSIGGIREVAKGAPPEWVKAFEEGSERPDAV